MIPVGPVGEVGDPLLRPLVSSRARFASDNDSKECPEQASGRNAEPPTSPTTATAVDQKVEQIREFVRWWDEGVKSRGNPEKKGSDLKSADRRKLNMADAESMTGISNQQVSRWRKRIKDEAAR